MSFIMASRFYSIAYCTQQRLSVNVDFNQITNNEANFQLGTPPSLEGLKWVNAPEAVSKTPNHN